MTSRGPASNGQARFMNINPRASAARFVCRGAPSPRFLHSFRVTRFTGNGWHEPTAASASPCGFTFASHRAGAEPIPSGGSHRVPGSCCSVFLHRVAGKAEHRDASIARSTILRVPCVTGDASSYCVVRACFPRMHACCVHCDGDELHAAFIANGSR